MADIQETLKENINEKTKSITVKDEFRKKGSKESDIDDNIWTLKKIKYSTFENEEGKDSLNINEFINGKIKLSESIETIEIFGEKITIEINNGKIDIKYRHNHVNWKFVSGMKIHILESGEINQINMEEEGC